MRRGSSGCPLVSIWATYLRTMFHEGNYFTHRFEWAWKYIFFLFVPTLEHRADFSVSWSFLQTVGLLGRVISSSQGLYLTTGQHKHRKKHTSNIHALSGIRTQDPGFGASEDSTCLRPLGYRDRQDTTLGYRFPCLMCIAEVKKYI
jgi:hypothetical protein